MKKNRILSMVLSFALLFTLFTSCDKTKDPNSSSLTPSSLTVSETLGEDEVVDMDGYKFVVASPWQRNVPPRDATTFERLWHEQKEKVQEDYNCEIVVESFYGSMEAMIPRILAGDKIGDVINTISDMWMPAVGAGYLRAWEEVSDTVDINDARWIYPNSAEVNGKHYVLSFERPGEIGTVLFYNKDVLKKAGITEDPARLALEDKWDWDKFREMLQKTTMDTTNDGKKDVFGIASFTGYSDIAFALARSNNSGLLSVVDKIFTNSYEKSEFMEALNFYDTLVNTDKVFRIYPNMSDPETWNDMPKSETVFGEFKNGKLGFLSARMWIANQQLKPYMENQYGMVLYPKGPKAEDYVADASTLGGFAIPITNKDYKKSAIIFNALAHPVEGYEDPEVMDEVIADDFFQEGDKDSFAVYKLALEKARVDFGYGVMPLYTGVNHAIVQSVFWRIDSPAAAIEGIKGIYNDDIKNAYKQLFD